MKKLTILLASILIITVTAFSQTDYSISGYVFDAGNGTPGPLEGQDVDILIDSTFSGFIYQNTVVTDNMGFFTDTITLPANFIEGLLHVSTFDICLGTDQEIILPVIPNSAGEMIEFMVCDTVVPPCEALFYYYPLDSNGFTSLNIQFIDISAGNPDSWLWDFGDGTTSTEQNPVHLYPDFGIYPVCLTITNSSNQCTSSFCLDVEIGVPPTGCESFFFFYPTGNPNEFTFEGFMANPATQAESYQWDFGDGSSATGQSVTHNFPADSSELFVVCLTTDAIDATTGDTCMYTSCQDVLVNYPFECVAMFFHYQDPDSISGVFFEDWSFTGNGGLPSEWFWEFGDSTTSTEQNPYHIYPDTGWYQVCLTISDSIGNCTDTYCEDIFVGEIIPPPGGCFNFFYYEKVDSATFTFNGEVYANGIIMTDSSEFIWDFGDGTTGTGQTVTHTFPADSLVNMYDVCLTTITPLPNTMGDTCMSVFCDVVFLEDPGNDCLNWIEYTQDTGLVVNFEGYTTSIFPTTYTWEFGDGITATGQAVSHEYIESGVYTVTLTTMDSVGCSSTSVTDVWVGDLEYSIFGNVYLDSNLTADAGTVRLMMTDSLWQNVIIVDSTSIMDQGYYEFEDVELNNFQLYFVQAELSDGSIYFGQYLPTYHISALTWENAMPILPIFSWPADIFMIPGNSINAGPGDITGTLTSLNVRENMAGIHVMLMSEDLEPYTYVNSDEAGNFSFENLPLGTYMVHAEVMGVHNTQAMVTLSEENPEGSLNFIIEGNQASLSVDEYVTFAGTVNLYPNPVTDQAWLELDVRDASDVNIQVFNQVGQLIVSESEFLNSGNNRVAIPTRSLDRGFYLLRITAENGESISRSLIKAN